MPNDVVEYENEDEDDDDDGFGNGATGSRKRARTVEDARGVYVGFNYFHEMRFRHGD